MQQEYQKTSANAGVTNANTSNGNNRLREEARLKAKKVVQLREIRWKNSTCGKNIVVFLVF